MRYWELQRDPRADERELARKVMPGKLPSWREFIGNKAHEIRTDGNGVRRKAITLRSINKHRKWLERRAREMARDNEDLPSMYGVDLEDREKKSPVKRSKSKAKQREDRIEKQIERGLASRKEDRKVTLKAALRGSDVR